MVGNCRRLPYKQHRFLRPPVYRHQWLAMMEDVQAEDLEPGVLVRAMYDYPGGDPSALAFKRGAIIEVFTQLDTGWWDGVLGDERGWFPRNYVELLTQEEATYLSSLGDHVDSGQREREEGMPTSLVPQSSHNYFQTDTPTDGLGPADDFWTPQVSASGQIFYRNLQTGEEARDLPSENHSEVHDAVDTEQATPRGWPTSYDTLGHSSRSVDPEYESTHWVRRLADDGVSVYWYNVHNGEISWAQPSVQISQPRSAAQHAFGLNGDVEDGYQALRRGFTQDLFGLGDTADKVLRGSSIYSDASDIQSLADASFDNDHVDLATATFGVGDVLPQTALAERNTRDLQTKLAPTSSEALVTYSNAAREAIREVTAIGAAYNGQDSSPTNNATLVMDRVTEVVLAVRNLLYISGTLASPLSSLMPQTVEAAESVRSPMLELKPLQRKVTATLSKLVLSARANKTNSAWTLSEAGPRVDYDAAELDRAVVTFVTEVQLQTAQSRVKRLRGVLESAEGPGGVGLGSFGGGLGGHSKALGFVPAEDSSERQVLGRNLSSEFKALRARVAGSLLCLDEVVRTSPSEAQANSQIRERGPVVVTELSSLLSLIEDVDVASYIDLTASRRGGSKYVTASKEARIMLRQLETSKQAMFDEGMLLLMVCQDVDISSELLSSKSSQKSLPHMAIQIISSILAHINQAQVSLEGLIAIAETQAEARRSASMSRRGNRARARDTIPPRANGHYSVPSLDIDPSLITISASDPSTFIDNFIGMEDAFGSGKRAFSDASSMLSMGDALSRPTPELKLTAVAASQSTSLGEASTNPNVPNSSSPEPSGMSTSASNARPVTPDSDDEFERLKAKTTPVAKKNLKEILGQDAPDLEEQPWYLRPSYREEDLRLMPDGSVRGGTLEALVETLTTHATRDNTFFDTFIMTFKSFTNLNELFDLLVARFEIKPPEGITPDEYEDWRVKLQAKVRIRAVNTIKAILSEEDVIGPNDVAILARIRDFATKYIKEYVPMKLLINLLDNINTKGHGVTKLPVSHTPHAAPAPVVPRVSGNRKLKLLDIDPLEFARQLTLKESELFMKIRAMDCLARAKDGQSDDDSIRAIISMSNKLADWVNDAVLSKDDPRKRALLIKHFILTAERCRSLNNFSTMAALVAALNSPPIRRLKRTWDVVSRRNIAVLDDIEKTMQHGKNLAEYRNMLSKVSLPCVPFIGVYLTTLTFIQDGMKDKLVKEGDLINFAKRLKAAAIIAEIKRYQSHPYSLSVIPVIRQFIDDALTLEQTSDYFWELSLKLEPREREDEKMARLLQESGFL
ncbi:ras guanine nucleotide exchange factor domain-containing protein [Cantharellus anzutake]|uniref:ras guanine nucleotide exchange factor domain-containing protein n=1 Tax=Cantharellus anzutake TaxID=1750568 RepID=UPI001903CCA7|nr:ras guanine nucleotide exchange factor domain-containing protein [Cantharellus anzutake]KAF8333499.1 ras guanine nucleotide exchange factor domain-containing protein [Cantharellus anzutake]